MTREVSAPNPKQSAAAPADPYSTLRREIDNVFASFFSGQGAAPAMSRGFLSPAMDVKEDDAAITLTAELPGLSEDEVEVSLHDGALTISGEKRREESRDDENYHVFERSYGSFRRAFTLPERADPEAVTADFDRGVLTVRVGKKQGDAVGPRRIGIGKKA